VAVMKSSADVSRALRDLEWESVLCCNQARRGFSVASIASSFDKHNADGKPDISRGGDGFVEMAGVDKSESESGSSCVLSA
jgi:hypothetical protein